MNTQKRTISCKDAALILGTSQPMVKHLVKTGKIPGLVVENPEGRDRIIIPRARFEEYLGEKIT